MAKLGKAFVGLALTAGFTVLGAGAASAHNHAFTPLGCLTTDNPNSGATVGFVQAADAAAAPGTDRDHRPEREWQAANWRTRRGERLQVAISSGATFR